MCVCVWVCTLFKFGRFLLKLLGVGGKFVSDFCLSACLLCAVCFIIEIIGKQGSGGGGGVGVGGGCVGVREVGIVEC